MTEDTLNVKIAALEKIMQTGFDAMNKRLDEICQRMVGMDRFDALRDRVARNERDIEELDVKVEYHSRIVWLISIIGGGLWIIGIGLIAALVQGWLG